MFRQLLSFVWVVCLSAQTPPLVKVLMRLPVDLYTAEGIRLEKGQYEIEVRRVKGQYELAFNSGGKTKALVNGRPSSQDAIASSATIPLVGTHYLGSQGEQAMKAGNRPNSKTGRSQYEEQERDWKDTLRVYKTADDSEALFVLQERQEQWEWNRIEFTLSLTPGAQSGKRR